MIKVWLDSYKPANKEDALQALREIMQEEAARQPVDWSSYPR